MPETETTETRIPIAVRIATIQVVYPYVGEDDADYLPETLGALVDAETGNLLDWRFLQIGGQRMTATTQTGAVDQNGFYVEGSAFE